MARFQMVPHARSNVLDVYAEKDFIDLNPDYQRIGGVWDSRKRRLLIDSIVNGIDLPKIYFHELDPTEPDLKGEKYRYAVVDGKQRLEAIYEFLEGHLKLPDGFNLFEDPSVKAGGFDYDELGREYPRLRSRFDRTELPIIVVKTDDFQLVKELFSRLNEAVVLTASEKRNTLGGPLPRMFREMSRHPFFLESLPFETERYRHLDLAAKFAYLRQEDSFQGTKKTTLDSFVREYPREGTETAQVLRQQVEAVLQEMHDCFELKDDLLNGIGWVTLFFHVFRLGGQHAEGFSRQALKHFFDAVATTRRRSRQITTGRSSGALTAREQLLAQFASYSQALNDGSALRARYELMRRDIAEQQGIVLPSLDDQC